MAFILYATNHIEIVSTFNNLSFKFSSSRAIEQELWNMSPNRYMV